MIQSKTSDMIIEISCEKLATELISELDRTNDWNEKWNLIKQKLMMVSDISFKEGRKLTGGKKCKVIQKTLDGNPIMLFNSATEAQGVTGIGFYNILRACKGQRKTAGGYKWAFAK